MKRKIIILIAMTLIVGITRSYSQTITISGTKFYANGQQIFLNGINTAWQPQSDLSLDYLGRNYDGAWWDQEFQRYADNKINFARVWIHGRGDFSPSTNGDGSTTGASAQFWSNMDDLIAKAAARKIYIMPCFWSFDMVKSGVAQKYTQYRQMITDPNKTTYYINNFLIPFLQRYNNQPYVMGYEICNEPDHMWGDSDCGLLPRDNVIRFVAMCAAAINSNTSKPVTCGPGWVIWNSSKKGNGGWSSPYSAKNNFSNAELQAQYANSNAYLDFYSPHFYGWQSTGGSFNNTLANFMDDTSKPTIIGETYGGDMYTGSPNNGNNYNISMADYYNNSYLNGFAGVCGWKNPSPGGDGFGDFAGIANGTRDFASKYPNLVYPSSPSGNLAQGKTVSASSTESGPNVVTNAVDGNYSTRWSSAYAEPQWFIVDLGARYNINRVKITWENAFAKYFQIQISTNNVNWTTIKDVPNNTSTVTDLTGLSGTARYVKVYCINRQLTQYGFSFYELEAYGTYVGAREALNENEIITESSNVYPNPTSDKVTIKLSEEWQKGGRISLINMTGETVITEKIQEAEHTFDLSNMPSGLYLINVSNARNKLTRKIYKK